MDRLAHNCLAVGARSSGARVHKIAHLDTDAFEAKIKEVRSRNTEDTVLVVTEGLFSMDSDIPELNRLQKITKKYQCTLVVDCAHSMFSMGKKGLGNVGDELDDFSNVIIIGSGSKTMGSNFGYIVSGCEELTDVFKYYAHSFIFTNALPPAVCATVNANLKILVSEEGHKRRRKLVESSKYIRKRLTEAGYECLGTVSPLIIVLIRSEVKVRGLSNFLYSEGVVVNPVEYPGVPKGEARLRLQLQAGHTKENLDHFVDALVKVDPLVDKWIENDNLVNLMMLKVTKELANNPNL